MSPPVSPLHPVPGELAARIEAVANGLPPHQVTAWLNLTAIAHDVRRIERAYDELVAEAAEEERLAYAAEQARRARAAALANPNVIAFPGTAA
jgi:hypothetical protein